ncbi:MAG TPA: CD225/dispanin family protein [Candidatus Eremiobacteraeota bacterium]|nr:MAG: Interferon-induced transmembrane protein [bacterium ADurb.Bin363]HPZ07832.1 CD225/dispanin family protein [Candidatus Eremiobacteraeota bacterium]
MYCRKCGTQNENTQFCINCGEPIQAVAPSPSYQQSSMSTDQHVPNYLVQAILVTLFCCLPCGVVAIVYAAQVNSKLQMGDYYGALSASRNANMWSWISFGCGIALIIINLLAAVAGSH